MTGGDLAALRAASGLRLPVASAEALRTAEDAADRRPADRDLDALVRELHRQVTAPDGLPPHVAGVRRERLIRWDAETTTWEGWTADGPAVLRVLRPHAARDPVLRRALLRTAAALEPACPGIAPIDGAWPALVLAVPGPALPEGGTTVSQSFPLARWLATGIAALARWEGAGLGLPRLAPEEWRHGPSGLSLACLTVEAPGHTGENLAGLAALLGEDEAEDAVSALVGVLAAAPPRRADEAAAGIVRAFAQDLAGARHRLAAARARSIRAGRHAVLADLVRRLDTASPAPSGRGAVGVDLDGHVTAISSDSATLRWGPLGAEELVWSRQTGVEPGVARRLLRARAAAAPSARLQREVGGSAEVVEAVTRWLAAAMRLRTTRLLVERPGA